MRNFLVRLLWQLALGLVILVVLLVGCQNRLIYHPRAYAAEELRLVENTGGRRFEVITSQGLQTAFYIPSRSKADGAPAFLWLVCGGNGALALDYADQRRDWDPRFAYLFIDYPGYGLCQGHPTPDHIRESMANLKVRVMQEFHWTADELVQRCAVLGHSIGAAAGLIAAEEWGLQRAVLCSAFTTMKDMARLTIGSPLCHLTHHHYDNLARLESLRQRSGRAILFHGTEDEAIPVWMSRQLNERFPGLTVFNPVGGAMHNDIFHLAWQPIGSAMLELSGLN